MVILTLFFLVAGDGERLGGAGESCMRTADCNSPLRCMRNICKAPAAAEDTKAPLRGDSVPAGWHVERVRDRTNWIGGLATFAGAHLITVALGAAMCRDSACVSWNIVPVVGPIVYAGSAARTGITPVAIAAEITSFVVQIVGVISLAVGLQGREVLVADAPSISVVPLLGPKLGGLSLAGSF